MATHQDFIEYVTEQVGLGNRLTFKKMFGEYAVYLDGKMVGLACDNSLFIKPSSASIALAPELPQRPPYPGAKNHPVADQLLDDTELLCRLVMETAAVMPAPSQSKSGKKSGDRSRRPAS